MYIVYYGISTTSDVKLAQEAGFHSVGSYCSSHMPEDLLRSLFHNLPAFMGSYITTSLYDFTAICRLIKSTQCQNICLLDAVPNAITERLRIAFPQIRILEQYRYLNAQENENCRNKCKLSIADGLVLNFRDFSPYQLTPELDIRGLNEFCDSIKKPVIFSGFQTIQQAENVLSRVRSYGIIIEKSIFQASGMTAHEALYNLSKTYVTNAANGMSSEHKIYKTQKITHPKPDDNEPKETLQNQAQQFQSINTNSTERSFKKGEFIPDSYLYEKTIATPLEKDQDTKLHDAFYESG